MENVFDSLFHQLNEQQIEAVTATEGYVRIIAGAGSGKTKTLTHRYAFLVKAAGIHPGNVLCVTFTNKAAGEMKRRVRSLIGDGYDTSLITTYHGFCVRVLREDIGRLFYPENFQILDEGDQKKILEEIYTELEIKLDRASFEKILESIHYIKAHEDYVGQMIHDRFVEDPNETLDKTIIRRYMQKQKKSFGLDFDDLISFTFAIFEQYPEVLQKWQERLHYIQVDEFQDSSFRELKLLQNLSALHKNLFVVGDPDQNIYGWRGADMSILLNFNQTFPGTKTVLLNQNYRSTGKILRAANTLIGFNKNRIPKDLFTTGSAGEDVIHLHAKSEGEEGKWMAGEIRRLVKEGKCAYRDVAVLYRSGFLSRFIEQALADAQIPYELFGSLRFYDRMEIRDAVAYLKLIAYNDNASFERIINTPKRMFGKRKLKLLRALAAEDGTSDYETLLHHLGLPEFRSSGAEAFVQMMEEARQSYKTMPLSDVIQNILVKSGYEQYIRETGSMERLDNLAEFKRTALEQERSYGEFYTLEEFLQYVALQRSQSEADGEGERDRVHLMTIHASKGLEFPVCFVCGFTDGIFPSGRTLEERKDAGLEEERRLCFVALTRAMKRLYLTESEGNASASNANFGGSSSPRKKETSRFIFEIGEENYRRIGVIPKELCTHAPAPSPEQEDMKVKSVGSVVEHPVFGRGVITEVNADKRVYSILFEKSNTVKPVDMDYDFDAWRNLASMRENAIAAARSQMEKSSQPEEQPTEKEEPQSTEEPKQDKIVQEPTESQKYDTSDFFKDMIKDIRQKWDEAEKSEAISETVAEATLEEEPFTEDSSIEDFSEEKSSSEGFSEEKFPDEKPSDVESFPPEAPPTIELPLEIASSEKEYSEAPPSLPEKYRGEDWVNAVDEGEQNLWKRSDVPHQGWECIDVIDLGAPVGVCRMCGHQIIRYVHVMYHPSYPKRIGAGCVCAGRMEGNPQAAKEREAAFRNWQARRETFLRLPLKRSRNGNEYVKYRNEIVTILKDKFRDGYYKSVSRGVFSPSYPTKEEALADAFSRLDPRK